VQPAHHSRRTSETPRIGRPARLLAPNPDQQATKGGTVRRDTIAIIWVGGLVLAAALYAVGPDRFLDACLNFLDAINLAFHNLALRLGAQAYAVARALAIALYAVFAILALLAAQRGHRAAGALVAVTIVFLILVWEPYGDMPTPLGRWIIALALVLIAAVVMTQRLLTPSPHRGGTWPQPPPGRAP
jgi:hypothetical protein